MRSLKGKSQIIAGHIVKCIALLNKRMKIYQITRARAEADLDRRIADILAKLMQMLAAKRPHRAHP